MVLSAASGKLHCRLYLSAIAACIDKDCPIMRRLIERSQTDYFAVFKSYCESFGKLDAKSSCRLEKGVQSDSSGPLVL